MHSLRLIQPCQSMGLVKLQKATTNGFKKVGSTNSWWKCANHFSNSAKIQKEASSYRYSVEEIQIPNGHQYGYQIACKVWRCTGPSPVEKEPPIICVHGWLDNANSFDPLLPLIMRPGRTFYAFDLPGHGRSSHINTTHYNGHVESHLSIHRVVRYLKLDKVSLLGHSMGAKAAVMFAGSFPEIVHKLVTLDGVNPCMPDWPQSTRLFVLGLYEIEGILAESPQAAPATYEELLRRMMKARAGIVTEEGCKALLSRTTVPVSGSSDKFRFSHDLKLRLIPGMALMTADQMIQFCSAVTAPVCVIKSSQNDAFSDQASKDFQTAFQLARTLTPEMKVEFHVAEGTHHVHLNEPEKVAKIISSFLDLK